MCWECWVGDGSGNGSGGVNLPTILPLDHILRFQNTLLIADINLHQIDFPRQSFSLELFHSRFTLFGGAAAQEDKVLGVVEELGGEGETDAAIGWDGVLVKLGNRNVGSDEKMGWEGKKKEDIE